MSEQWTEYFIWGRLQGVSDRRNSTRPLKEVERAISMGRYRVLFRSDTLIGIASREGDMMWVFKKEEA